MARKYLFITLLIIILDQILKNLLPYKIKNYGAAFNLLENYSIFLILISFLALVLFVYLFFKTKYNELAFALLISGTISNLIDRLFWGYVIDYIPFFGLFTFNLADLANTIGVILLLKNLGNE